MLKQKIVSAKLTDKLLFENSNDIIAIMTNKQRSIFIEEKY